MVYLIAVNQLKKKHNYQTKTNSVLNVFFNWILYPAIISPPKVHVVSREIILDRTRLQI